MRTEKDIDKIIANIKATLAVERLKPSKESEEIGRRYLRGEITSEEAVKIITDNILRKGGKMNIQKPSINWRGNLTPLNRNNIQFIVIHHMSHETWGFWDVHNFHRNTRGWLGVAYNFFISFNGDIIQGRGFNQGAGVIGENHRTIHIGCQGAFQTQTPPESQINSVIELCKWLKKELPNAKQVVGHNYFGGTSCPERNFPLQRVVNTVNNNINIPSNPPLLRQGDKGETVRELQSKLIELGYDLGHWGADGDFGNATNTAVRQFQTDNKLTVDGIVGNQTWGKLDELIEEKNKPKEEPKPEPEKEKPKQDAKELEENHIPAYKIEGLKNLHKNGFVYDFDLWKERLDEKMPVWTAMLIMSRIYDDLKNK